MKVDKIYAGDCLKILGDFPDNSIDAIITSPPYDDLRKYGGHGFIFTEDYPKTFYRILKEGGVCVWVVGDKVEDGSETLSSFKQALTFRDEGFKVHDTMIYQKDSFPAPQSNRYLQCFEYMFIFSKGTPKTFNPITITTRGYKGSKTSTKRYPDGQTRILKYEQGKNWRKIENIWCYGVGFMKSSPDRLAFEHPATFPEDLAEDHIRTWTNKGDVVLDPFNGSGTTCLVARRLCRKYVGIEINPQYVKIATKRLNKIPAYLDAFCLPVSSINPLEIEKP